MPNETITDLEYGRSSPRDGRRYWRILFKIDLVLIAGGIFVFLFLPPILVENEQFTATGASTWIRFCHMWQQQFSSYDGDVIHVVLFVGLWFAASGRRHAKSILVGWCILVAGVAVIDVVSHWSVANAPPGVVFASTSDLANTSIRFPTTMTYVFSWSSNGLSRIAASMIAMAPILAGLCFWPPQRRNNNEKPVRDLGDSSAVGETH